jgi:hypothetical protein
LPERINAKHKVPFHKEERRFLDLLETILVRLDFLLKL